jgi:hypothetical protein
VFGSCANIQILKQFLIDLTKWKLAEYYFYKIAELKISQNILLFFNYYKKSILIEASSYEIVNF